jgi:hypothetical protein
MLGDLPSFALQALPSLDLAPLPPLLDGHVEPPANPPPPSHGWPKRSKHLFHIIDRKYGALDVLYPAFSPFQSGLDESSSSSSEEEDEQGRPPHRLPHPHHHKPLPYEIDSEDHAEAVCTLMCRKMLKEVKAAARPPA